MLSREHPKRHPSHLGGPKTGCIHIDLTTRTTTCRLPRHRRRCVLPARHRRTRNKCPPMRAPQPQRQTSPLLQRHY
eukprot:scaffold86609_cov30-Tisochrysis_lutea.AAC.2